MVLGRFILIQQYTILPQDYKEFTNAFKQSLKCRYLFVPYSIVFPSFSVSEREK